jgi:hypothetical protein
LCSKFGHGEREHVTAKVMRFLVVALLLAALPGCKINPFGDESGGTTTPEPLPGDAIGSFSVSAVETANTCGEGALGETPTWSFAVNLSKDGTTIYWDSGSGPVTGVLAADAMGFSFSNTIVTDMRPPADPDPETDSTGTFGVGGGFTMPALPPCSMARVDSAVGTLSSTVDPIASFSGSLTYAYAPTPGSSCADLVTGTITTPPQFQTLPCGMTFSISGARQ